VRRCHVVVQQLHGCWMPLLLQLLLLQLVKVQTHGGCAVNVKPNKDQLCSMNSPTSCGAKRPDQPK
jgi:hypothetical protein